MRRIPPWAMVLLAAATLLAADIPTPGERPATPADEATARAAPVRASVGPLDGADAVNFQLVGHDPLLGRGMNAALALYTDPGTNRRFAYVGSRTDGQPHHPNAGVLVVDVTNPAGPRVVGEIGVPLQGNVGETSRELRVWPQEKLLIVLNFPCSSLIHACSPLADLGAGPDDNIRFYDLTQPAHPRLVATYHASYTPHEFFLWVDPRDATRALLYMSTPTASTVDLVPNVLVVDISDARDGRFTELASWNGNSEFSDEDRANADVRVHSVAVAADGTRAYLAYLGGGVVILDSSDFTKPNVREPRLRTITDIDKRPHWGDPGAHSAVKVPGRPYVFVTDEVYGDLLDPITGFTHGCPWGWARIIDAGHRKNEVDPDVVAEYRIAQNQRSYCGSATGGGRPTDTLATSYAAHNPTLLPDLAFVTWHSGGLQAIDLADPTTPRHAGHFLPEPLDLVATEDPALGMGESRVIMWSFPIIQNGLIHVVDLRNGLYILRYSGPGADAVRGVQFLEGNSNLHDAQRLDR